MSAITDPIILDSTGQAIKNSIDLLSANINRTASNIPYDNNLTIKGKIDEIEDEITEIDAKTAYDIPFTNMTSTGDKLQEVSVGSARVLKAFTWNYTAQSFEVNASETFLIYGCRAGRGLLYIVPINNNEICEVYDGFGITVTHTASADLKTHTISISAPSAMAGSTCQIFAIGRNI